MPQPGPRVTPDLLLRAYAMGIFPMADGRDAPEVYWVDPRMRGILPLDRFHISRSLARRMRRGGQEISFDRAFESVIGACADRPETWINAEIRALYRALHARGAAHSIEVWQDGQLVGGVYGVVLGAAFFGESMFSRATDASKIALAYLCDRLRQQGFELFDTQFLTPHLASLGAIEVPRHEYRRRLASAISRPVRFDALASVPSPQDVMQRSTQTS